MTMYVDQLGVPHIGPVAICRALYGSAGKAKLSQLAEIVNLPEKVKQELAGDCAAFLGWKPVQGLEGGR